MLTFTVNGVQYHLTMKKTSHDDVFVSVFQVGQKLPILGTTFSKKNIDSDEILRWAKINMEEYVSKII